MGREVRMVPKDWEHPKDENGHYIPLYEGSRTKHNLPFSEKIAQWDEEKEMWAKGLRRSFSNDDFVPVDEKDRKLPFEDWAGERPIVEDFMPEWSDKERTHLQMYEDCTEGTPISPVMKTPEELARWLADNNASACGSMTATYEQWLCTIKQGFAISMIFCSQEGLKSGVEACSYD